MADIDQGAAEEDSPLSTAESLALIEHQRRETHRRLGANAAWFYLPWGIAYLVGFGSVFLTYPSTLPVHLTSYAAGVIGGIVFVGAIVSSVVIGARSGRGVRGPSRSAGKMYGWAWSLGFLTLNVVNLGVARLGLPPDAITLLWSGSSLLLVGVLYLAGGALMQDRFQYGLGVWMLVTGAASVFAGVPGNFLLLSLAGGGGLLLGSAYFALRSPRVRA